MALWLWTAPLAQTCAFPPGAIPCQPSLAPPQPGDLLLAFRTTLGTNGLGQYPLSSISAVAQKGTITNDNAPAGNIGEYISASVASGSAVSLTTNTAAPVASVSLTAGDWNCGGDINFYPGGTTTVTQYAGGLSTVSTALPTNPAGGAQFSIQATFTTGAPATVPVGLARFSVNTSTTVYLVGLTQFGASTMTAGGFVGCRRMR